MAAPVGNVWASDYNASETVLGGKPTGGRRQQVFKFKPTVEIPHDPRPGGRGRQRA